MINSNLSKFGRILSIIRKRTKYSLILRSFLIAYTPMTFFTIVQLHNLKFVETGNIVDSSFCILSIIYLFVFPLVIFIILNVKKYNLEDEEIKSKFYTIYDSLQTNAIFKKNFILFYLMRKILWPLFIIIYLDDPLYQIFGLICLSVTIITLLILKKPYKSKVIFREFVLNELLVLSVLILISTHVIISYLDSNDMDLDLAVQIGWILVGLVSSVIFSIKLLI